VVVVDVCGLSGVFRTVVGVLVPPVRGRAVAPAAGMLKAMTDATTPTARHLTRLMVDTLARLSRPL
jgi:hypothetical protein